MTTPGFGRFLAEAGKHFTKLERESVIEEDVLANPDVIVKDMQTGDCFRIRSVTNEEGKGRTLGFGYRRLKDSEQHLPFKVSPTLQLSVLLDMLVPMLAPEYNSDEELDYENPENWSPLVKAAYRRIAEAMTEATDLKLKPKEQAKLWKERHAKHRKAVDAVLKTVREGTLTTKSGDMIASVEITAMEGEENDI